LRNTPVPSSPQDNPPTRFSDHLHYCHDPRARVWLRFGPLVVVDPTTRVELDGSEVVSTGLTYQQVFRAPENMVLNIERDVFSSLCNQTKNPENLSFARHRPFQTAPATRQARWMSCRCGKVINPIGLCAARAPTLVPATLRIVAVALTRYRNLRARPRFEISSKASKSPVAHVVLYALNYTVFILSLTFLLKYTQLFVCILSLRAPICSRNAPHEH
jgi:hypothetical protein